MPTSVENNSVSPEPTEPGSHIIMFWLLTSMALVVFAACVLLPIWLETETLMQREAQAEATVAAFRARLAEQDRVIAALTSDPLVNERLARRELRFRRVEEDVWPVNGPSSAGESPTVASLVTTPALELPPAPEPPPIAQWAHRWLPRLPWVELFAKPPNRTIFLLMAGGLLVAAFVLYGPRPGEPDVTTSSDPSA